MEIFLSLFLKLIPLYITIFLGFISGKYLGVKKESVATLVIYLITPVIFFNGVLNTQISLSSLSLPLLVFAVCCFICLLFYFIGGFFWQNALRNILGFISSDGNNGYFGLPVALLLFDSSLIGLYIFAGLGILLYENTLGFFIAARGHYSIKESITKLLKLPLIYAIALGLIINLSGIRFGSNYLDVVNNFKGAYTILGMMIIGLGLSSITEFTFDIKFIGLSFLAKFLVWPLIIFFIIFLDNNLFKIYDTDIHQVLILLSVVPLAANTVAFATTLKTYPEKVAVTVLLSTIFALFYIPIIAVLFLQ